MFAKEILTRVLSKCENKNIPLPYLDHVSRIIQVHQGENAKGIDAIFNQALGLC
jgi:hypothetical protein